ncbi:tRNA(Met) cytidine acetate ligase [Paenibacillus sp. CECT 9249]|nr:tRNA(Met) cytidine acetate ligase [Paenibacillus sp. CECT 9249]
MLRTVGIIVEYNPLHNGHVYHFHQSKEQTGAGAVVAIMSGHFLQRGEPAIVDKWARAEMALAMGVDLVLELPVAYAVQPAEWFAYGAVRALDATGVVDALCFGSECGELTQLRALAKLLRDEPPGLRELVRAELKRGASYPTAFAAAVAAYAAASASGVVDAADLSALLAQPNNTLGLHYLIALERLRSAIEPYTVARVKAGYGEERFTDAHIASATAIRKRMAGGDPEPVRPYMPEEAYRILRREIAAGRGGIGWEAFAGPLFHSLLARSAAELAGLHEVNEGLEHRIKQALPLLPSVSVAALLAALKTKRYTHTKLQRTLTHILLQHPKRLLTPDKLRQGAGYLRVLGFSRQGQELLKRMKKTAKVPVVTNAAQYANRTGADPLFALDLRASSVYAAATAASSPRALFRDYYEPPLRR